MKKQSEEIEQHQSDSHMAEMFELSGWEFKITVINILRVLMETVNNMQEQMGDVSKEMETKEKNQKKMPEIINAVIEIKIKINTFDALICRPDMAKKRISKL